MALGAGKNRIFDLLGMFELLHLGLRNTPRVQVVRSNAVDVLPLVNEPKCV